jgi:glycosyltransferase involved in cell wall biosynthesis
MHITILAPSDRSFIIKFLPAYEQEKLPIGYQGAPFIGSIISELLKNNHQVTAITTSVAVDNDYEIKTFNTNNFSWIVVPSRPHSFKMNGNKLGRMVDFYSYEIKQITKLVKALKPAIVHAHWSYEFAGAAIKSGFPTLVTVHDNAFQVLKYFRNAYRFGRMLMAEFYLRKIRFASTVSPYMENYVKRNCKLVKVIPNPIAIDMTICDIERTLNSKMISLNNPRLLMINNGWDGRKNGLSGLLAFKDIQEMLPGATLHLYGYGSEVNGLAYKDTLKVALKNIFFHGFVSNERLLTALKEAHILLHPALEESFGVVLIEAMAFGIPTIGGQNSGAVPWVVNNSALLVNVLNPGDICNCAINLLTKKDLYRSTVIAGYNNTVNRFSAQVVVDEYIAYYNFIIKNWK